jgi:hypothetical protein
LRNVKQTYRRVLAVVLLAWLAGAMSLSWEYQRATWLVFGLVSAAGVRGRAPGAPSRDRQAGARDAR